MYTQAHNCLKYSCNYLVINKTPSFYCCYLMFLCSLVLAAHQYSSRTELGFTDRRRKKEKVCGDSLFLTGSVGKGSQMILPHKRCVLKGPCIESCRCRVSWCKTKWHRTGGYALMWLRSPTTDLSIYSDPICSCVGRVAQLECDP